jgi:predicted ATP-grasp superfamily ATP-dependent carboligase
MVEFKRDRATGIHYLMEVNGRLWGSLQLAIDAGVDFPALIVDIERGAIPDEVSHYTQGRALRSLWSDLDHALVRLRHSAATLELPAGSPSRFTVLLDFLTWSRRERSETLRWNDPRPFLFESRRYFAKRLGLARNGGV